MIKTALLLLAMVFGQFAQATDDPAIEINDHWVNVIPGNSKSNAGYLTIDNKSGQTIVFKSASSPQFAMVHLHKSMESNSMMMMKPVDSIEIEAGQSLVMQPGGFHLMLKGPTTPIQAGDPVQINLKFADGTEITVDTAAKP